MMTMRRKSASSWSSLLYFYGSLISSFCCCFYQVTLVNSFVIIPSSLPSFLLSTTRKRHNDCIILGRNQQHKLDLPPTFRNNNNNIRITSCKLQQQQQQQRRRSNIEEDGTVEQRNRTWEECFQLLVSYKEKHGNCNVPARYKDDSRLGWWVQSQRKTKDRLSDERIVKLDDLGFSWGKKRRTWEENFQLLVAYKEQNGHCNVPSNYEDDPRLGMFVGDQRRKKETLSDEKRTKLDTLGFTWKAFRSWEENYQLLVSYKDKHGNCNVPIPYKDDSRLGNWVSTQRHRKDSLSNERIVKLDNLGFLWARGRPWEESFQQLVTYKEQYGHCDVPRNYNDTYFARWVNTQRTTKESGRLSDERYSKLMSLGFKWRVTRSWEESFQLLVSYKEKYGNCNVPMGYKDVPSLGSWVHSQRQLRKLPPPDLSKKIHERKGKSGLSDEQCAKLDALGFSWGRSNKTKRKKQHQEETTTIV